MTKNVMTKKTLFSVIDTETTQRDGLVFDFAYKTVDRKGSVFGKGSFLAKDVLAYENPWYKEKISKYWEMAYNREIIPTNFMDIAQHYNIHIKDLKTQGYTMVVCAYNMAFDVRVLSTTAWRIAQNKFLLTKVGLLDIWDAWSISCPVRYGKVAPRSHVGNIRTTAEEVYRFETGNPDFNEAHTAAHDVDIETEILLKVIGRKQTLPIKHHPADFTPHPWKLVQERVGLRLDTLKTKDNFMPAKD